MADYLKKHKHPAREKYNGFRFYLYDAHIIVKNEMQLMNANWTAPKNKYTSEYKKATIRIIKKIIELKPIRLKKHIITRKYLVK